ncbi:MAG: hypothetical protein ACRDMX_02570 [Solirubrobacteraceae bacterium]
MVGEAGPVVASVSSPGRSVREAWPDQFPQLTLLRGIAVVDDKIVVDELRLRGRVLLAREAMKQLVLSLAEGVQSRRVVEWLLDSPGEMSPGPLATVPRGGADSRVGMPAASRHPDPAVAER